MSDTHKVIIDGVEYVPAVTTVPDLDMVMQALCEQYMLPDDNWRDTASELWIEVNEDGEGETLEEFAARVARLLSGSTKEEQ